MCRILAYIGPELPLQSLLLDPENSLINQSLDPELHPHLQLVGWGFAAWSKHLLKPEEPLLYHRPKAAFYDDNAKGIIPSLQASTMLAHVRASGYDSDVVQADENCHPIAFDETQWILAHNGALPNWRRLQRELLPYCEDRYLKQMRGTTDTEFLFVLLLSLLEGDSDADIQKGFERLLKVILKAMKTLDLTALTKLKLALVTNGRIIGANYGCGRDGETDLSGDWKDLRPSENNEGDMALSMVMEPMYLLMGKNFQDHKGTYDIDPCPEQEATSAVFASEPLTEDGETWTQIQFGEIVFLEKRDGRIKKTVAKLNT